MMMEKNLRTGHVATAAKATMGQRVAKPKAEETLIEEILKAAGLEAMD